MTVYEERSETLQAALNRSIEGIGGADVTLRDLLARIGDHGPLLLCAVMTVPFLLPISVPGVSTVFGLAIILLGFGIAANRLPWLPARIMDRALDGQKLEAVLRRGLQLAERIERVIRKRVEAVTTGRLMNRLNGLAIVAGGVLLMFPLGLVPFSNTLPAFAILFLSLGMAQRDGAFVLAGYMMLLVTVIYFAALAYAAVAAGQGIVSMFTSG